MKQTPTFIKLGDVVLDLEFENIMQLADSHAWDQPQLCRPPPLEKCSVIYYNHFGTSPINIYKGILGWYSQQDQMLMTATLPLIDRMRRQFFPTCRPVKGEISYLGANIKQGMHIDPRKFHKIAHRAHLCLTTCPDAFLMVKHERQHIAVGEVWTFDNLEPHCSINTGTGSRIHMIIDFMEETVWLDFVQRYGELALYALDSQAVAQNKILNVA